MSGVQPQKPHTTTYIGFAVLSASAIVFEILLTRIFSATMYYHFAFIAVAVAMFGLTVGALLLYLIPHAFKSPENSVRIFQSTLCFALSSVIAVIVYAQTAFTLEFSYIGLLSMAKLYLLFSCPFVFVGIATTLLLTRFHPFTGKLYACDLFGAGTGCILVIFLLYNLDPICISLLLGVFASIAAALFSRSLAAPLALLLSLTVLLACTALSVQQMLSFKSGKPLFRFCYAKGEKIEQPLYEKWNPFSWIRVSNFYNHPMGWGMSTATPAQPSVEQLLLQIDAGAGTLITKFDGDLGKHAYLKFDVINFAQHLKHNSDVLVIGVGGGRDLLSALVFKQASATGVEINDSILDLLRGQLAAFTGNLASNPFLHLVHDEARSYISRSKQKWDIIQASLIDTWAASSLGSFALSENSLYTVEGWSSFYEHLKPKGLLSFSRWYDKRNTPIEYYRLCALGAETLRKNGVTDPRRQMLGIVNDAAANGDFPNVGTLLISNSPFTSEDLDNAERFADSLNFKIVLSPRGAADHVLEQVTAASVSRDFYNEFSSNIIPPTDDCPFFFNFKKLNFTVGEFNKITGSADGVQTLKLACLITTALTALVISLPLLKHLTLSKNFLVSSRKAGEWLYFLSASVFFSSIGIGFILVELSIMQRLSMLLGNPTLSLTVVLFSFLIGGGCGSLLSSRISEQKQPKFMLGFLFGLLFVIIMFLFLLPQFCLQLESAQILERMLFAITVSFIPAIFMGTAFPMGMTIVQNRGYSDESSWFWAMNGACGVLATVLSAALSLAFGLQTALFCGLVSYLFALMAAKTIHLRK